MVPSKKLSCFNRVSLKLRKSERFSTNKFSGSEKCDLTKHLWLLVLKHQSLLLNNTKLSRHHICYRFIKNYAANRHLYMTNASYMILANKTSSERNVTNEAEVSNTCLLHTDKMAWEPAKQYCESLDLVLFEPRSVTEARGFYECAGSSDHKTAWTGYQWNGIIAENPDILGFTGEYYAVLR